MHLSNRNYTLIFGTVVRSIIRGGRENDQREREKVREGEKEDKGWGIGSHTQKDSGPIGLSLMVTVRRINK